MTNINLSYGPEKPLKGKNIARFSGWSLIVSLTILAISAGMWGGLKIANQKMQEEKKSLENEIQKETGQLNRKDAAIIDDFTQRLDLVKRGLESKINTNEFLAEISLRLIPGSLVKSFNLDSKTGVLAVNLEADNWVIAAKQLLSFKKSDKLKNSSLKSISKENRTDKDGKTISRVLMSVEIKI